MSLIINLFFIIKIPIAFHGSAGTSVEYKPSMENIPAIQKYQIYASPQLMLWNIPFGSNISFYAIKKETLTTNITYRFYISFSPVEHIKKKLPILQAIQFGDFSPTMTSYTLSDIRIRGIGVSINPFRKILFASYYGKVLKSVETEDEIAFNRYLAAVQFGFGAITRIVFNLLKIEDEINSLPDTVEPKENVVMSMNFNLSVIKKINIAGEIAGTAITEDKRDSVVEYKKLEPLYIIFKPRTSTHGDVAANIGIETKPHEKITYDIKYFYVGPGFNSFGISSIKNDVQGFSTKLKVMPFKNFSSQAQYTYEENNLAHSKVSTSIKDKFIINSTIKIKKMGIGYRFYYCHNKGISELKDFTNEVTLSYALTKNLMTTLAVRHKTSIIYSIGMQIMLIKLKYSYSKSYWEAEIAPSYKLNKVNLTTAYGLREHNKNKEHKLAVRINLMPTKIFSINLEINSKFNDKTSSIWTKLNSQITF